MRSLESEPLRANPQEYILVHAIFLLLNDPKWLQDIRYIIQSTTLNSYEIPYCAYLWLKDWLAIVVFLEYTICRCIQGKKRALLQEELDEDQGQHAQRLVLLSLYRDQVCRHLIFNQTKRALRWLSHWGLTRVPLRRSVPLLLGLNLLNIWRCKDLTSSASILFLIISGGFSVYTFFNIL